MQRLRKKIKSSFNWTYNNTSNKYRWNRDSFWPWNPTWNKITCLNDKSKAASRNRLLAGKFLFIDELSKVSSELWAGIDFRLAKF